MLQVETTMTKGIFRVVTTAVGGAAAVAVMARPAVAASPYILSAILLAFDFVVALWMTSQFKYAGGSSGLVPKQPALLQTLFLAIERTVSTDLKCATCDLALTRRVCTSSLPRVAITVLVVSTCGMAAHVFSSL
jgi:ABC-type branched-subunit amino acid transport system permease subunit